MDNQESAGAQPLDARDLPGSPAGGSPAGGFPSGGDPDSGPAAAGPDHSPDADTASSGPGPRPAGDTSGPRPAGDNSGPHLAGGHSDPDASAAGAGSKRSAEREAEQQESERVPEEWEIEGPAVSISLGDAADLDPALLAAMTGPDGLGGEALGPQFGQDCPADALRPGPVLAALTEQAVASAATLTDDQLTGALQAARRLENRACWQQTVVIAELARRRQAEHHDALARGVPRGCRSGEFPADELAAELLITRRQAEHRLDNDLELTSRLPATLAGMAAGLISAGRADLIAYYASSLSAADAPAPTPNSPPPRPACATTSSPARPPP